MPIWKGKGEFQDLGKYRGIMLLSHVMKVLDRILDGRIRKSAEMEIREEQQRFRKGRGSDDRWDVCPDTAGGEEVGGVRWDGIGEDKEGKSARH